MFGKNKTKTEEPTAEQIRKKMDFYVERKHALGEMGYTVPFGNPASIDDETIGLLEIKEGFYKYCGENEDKSRNAVLKGKYIPTGGVYVFDNDDREDLDQYIDILAYQYKKALKREEKEAKKAEKIAKKNARKGITDEGR